MNLKDLLYLLNARNGVYLIYHFNLLTVCVDFQEKGKKSDTSGTREFVLFDHPRGDLDMSFYNDGITALKTFFR